MVFQFQVVPEDHDRDRSRVDGSCHFPDSFAQFSAVVLHPGLVGTSLECCLPADQSSAKEPSRAAMRMDGLVLSLNDQLYAAQLLQVGPDRCQQAGLLALRIEVNNC